MFTILNRLRGTNGVWSKFNGLLLAYILFSVFNNHYVALGVGIGYIIGECFKWGEAVANLSVWHKYLSKWRKWLFFRGIVWWVCLLPLIYYIAWYYVILAIILLAFCFPLACEIGYHTSKLWNFKYMSGGAEHQEVWYGFFQDIIIIGGLIYGLN